MWSEGSCDGVMLDGAKDDERRSWEGEMLGAMYGGWDGVNVGNVVGASVGVPLQAPAQYTLDTSAISIQ